MDFQTNKDLAHKVVKQLSESNITPEIVIEPTCGKGNFIIASLTCFTSIKKLFGIEIYKPYVWETKFNILDFYLSNPNENGCGVTYNNNTKKFSVSKNPSIVSPA